MAKKNTLLAMLAGAALAGGFLYMKKLNEQAAAPAPEGEGAPEGENPSADYGWKATFTDETGKEIPADDAAAEFKEEAVKALNEFKETAKVAGAEILTGLKKAFEEMKVAVADAQAAAAERRTQMAEEGETCEAVDEALEDAKEAFEEAKEDVEEAFEDAKEAFEDVKEACCEKVEEACEAVEEKAEEIKEKVEE